MEGTALIDDFSKKIDAPEIEESSSEEKNVAISARQRKKRSSAKVQTGKRKVEFFALFRRNGGVSSNPTGARENKRERKRQVYTLCSR